MEDDIFSKEKKEVVEKQPKKKRRAVRKKRKPPKKRVITLIPSDRAEINTMQFPEGTRLKEISEKLCTSRFTPAECDFKKVGQTEGMTWYLGITCNATDAFAGSIVVPEAYAKMKVALDKQEEEGYYLLVVPEEMNFHIAVGKKDVLYYYLIGRNIKNYTLDTLREVINNVIQQFKLFTFPAIEIKKTLILGDVPVALLPAFPLPIRINVDPSEYAGELNLSPKHHYKDRFSWEKLIVSLPMVERNVVVMSAVFLLALSWVFPVNAGISYVNKLYEENNQKIIQNIAEIQGSKNKLLKVLKQLKDEEALVESWNKAAQSIKPIDYVKFSRLVTYYSGVESFGLDKDKVVIVARASSPDVIDAYMKKLIGSGYFKSFEAPQRKAGENTYLLRGTLK